MGTERRITVNGQPFVVDVESVLQGRARFTVAGRTYEVSEERTLHSSSPAEKRGPQAIRAASQTRGDGSIAAPIPGVVVEIVVTVGTSVSPGDVLIRLEAMKMQNNINADCAGVVSEIFVRAGEEVRDGQPLLKVTANS